MTTRHEYIEKLKHKLDKWDADIDEFEDKAQAATAELKFELEDQLKSLRLKRDIAKLKLSEIKDASEEAWNDLKNAIEKARAHF